MTTAKEGKTGIRTGINSSGCPNADTTPFGKMSSNPQHVVDTEDAAELNLGDDFRHETCLSNAEVAVILEKQKSDYDSQEKQLTR